MYRSKVMPLAFVIVLIATSLLGCQQSVPSTAVPKQKSVTIVIPEDPPSFNPIITETSYSTLIMELVLLGLSGIDQNGNIFPELAAELPTIENGSVIADDVAGTMSVTWKMRQDVQWADKKPVTADDVIFTYKALVNPETGGWIPGVDYIDSIEKVDDYSFTINYSAIYPGYLTQFGPDIPIWPAHYCDAKQGFSSWDCARKPLSDGPFILSEWVSGDHKTFIRNDNYFEKGKPGIDKIIVRAIPDQAVRISMLVHGDADLDMWTTEQAINDLKGNPNVEVSLSPTSNSVMRIIFNLAAKGTTDPVSIPHPILSDLRVRQAIRAAIDVDTISKEFFLGYAKPVWTEFFRPPYACSNIPRPKFDLKTAAALLDEAGWKDTDGDGVRECRGCKNAEEGYKMEMEFITYMEYGEPLELTQQFIAEQLGKLGMKLNLTTVEGRVLWAASTDGGIEQSGNFDMDIWDDSYYGVDPTDFVWSYYSTAAAVPDAGYNYARWSNVQFETLLSGIYTLDEQQRKKNFCAMASILEAELPELQLFTTINADAHSVRLQNIQASTNDLVTWNAADWILK